MPVPPVPILALEWYRSTPLPDSLPAKPPPPGPTELSRRLTAAFDAGLYCDLQIDVPATASESAATVSAHRVVLQRNPALCLDGNRVSTPVGMNANAIRAVIRLHYLDVEASTPDANLRQIGTNLVELCMGFSEEEQALLQALFGSLQTSRWLQLRDAVNSKCFSDCTLHLGGGIVVPAHRAIVAGTEDGHFFNAALRWPGADNQVAVTMPGGLSQEALLTMLQVRYGGEQIELEYILEARHFSELFDWPFVRQRCEEQLEAVLASAGAMSSESLLAVVSHADESVSLPAHLKTAALTAAVREWSKVTEAAEQALPSSRCAELRALNSIRNRDGHICNSLEEYLPAAADDLSEWEHSLGANAPMNVRKQVEQSWAQWNRILFEYGRIFGAEIAERLREKARARREQLRDERLRGATPGIPAGRVMFDPTSEWREVPSNAICPVGLEYRFDMQTQRNYARLML